MMNEKMMKNNAVLENEEIMCVLAYSKDIAKDTADYYGYDEDDEYDDEYYDDLIKGMFVWHGTEDIESGDSILVDTICGSEEAIVYDVVYLPKYETKYLFDAWED